MFEPLLMSKEVFDELPQGAAGRRSWRSARRWRRSRIEAAKADDEELAKVYAKAGGKVYDLDAGDVEQVAGDRRATPRGRTTPSAASQLRALLKLARSGQRLSTPRDRRRFRRDAGSRRPDRRGVARRARAGGARRAQTAAGRASAIALGRRRRCVLTSSVVARYFFKIPTDWQDETAVFLLVGATFLCGACVQALRGHVGIEALAASAAAAARTRSGACSSTARLAFCAFFAWKRWTLLHEAGSTARPPRRPGAPPLWIPYVLMALGMTLLACSSCCRCWRRHRAPAPTRARPTDRSALMSTLRSACCTAAPRWSCMFSGTPIAFALGAVAVVFMAFFMPAASLDTVTQNVYEEMASITLLSIPLFILKGAAIGRSRAGQDLYAALHAWMRRVPGGLGIANVFACAPVRRDGRLEPGDLLGDRHRPASPRCGKRGYSPGFAAGIIAAGGTLGILLPPSITMILYAVAAEQSLGRLFLAGIGPGCCWSCCSPATRCCATAASTRRAQRPRTPAAAAGRRSSTRGRYTLREKVEMLPRVLPFVILLTGVMVALYGGYRHAVRDGRPRRRAGAGADRGGLRRLAARRPRADPRRTLGEATMLMMIIGMSLLYSYVMSYLHISQSAAAVDRRRCTCRSGCCCAAILLLVVVLGFFLPPVSIILMTAPIILPPLKAAGFDLIWFGVVMTIVMEMGLIHPPVGLNIFVIKNIAPDIPLRRRSSGACCRSSVLMAVAVVILSAVPGIAMWLPNLVYG